MNLFRLLAAGLIVFSLSNVVMAGVIIGPVSATSNRGAVTNTPENAINQSGLTANYVSGVTDFDSFAATSSFGLGPTFLAAGTAPGTTLDMDLGGVFTIDGIGYWGTFTNGSVTNYNLTTSLNSDFSDSTDLGDFTASAFTFNKQVGSFAPTDAQFVRLTVNSAFNNSFGATFGEVAFRGESAAAVPEPSSLALMALGTAGIAVWRRRKQSGSNPTEA